MSSAMQADLKLAGFLVNEEKSIWEPSQSMDWLGFSWDTVQDMLFIPQSKKDKFLIKISKAISSKSITIREIASIAGYIISFQQSLENICSIMSRFMHIFIANSLSWDDHVILNAEIVNEFNFWLHNFNSLPSQCFFKEKFTPQRIVYTDASKNAAAGYIVECADSIVHKMWTSEESAKSSTWREMKAVETTLLSSADKISNRTVKVYTDNPNVVKIVKSGSMKKDLHDIACKIFFFCIKNHITLEVEWIPRDQNNEADCY